MLFGGAIRSTSTATTRTSPMIAKYPANSHKISFSTMDHLPPSYARG